MNKDEGKVGRLPYNIQAKNEARHLKYAKILSEMPVVAGVMNVILHKQTEKANDRFVLRDKFAIMKMNDFMALIKKLKDYEELSKMVEPYSGVADELDDNET